jgi:hypothetical protein
MAAHALLVAFVILSLDSLYESPSANLFVRDGGHWVRDNLPTESRIYTNSNRLAFYAKLDLDWSARNTGEIPGKQAWGHRKPLLPPQIEGKYDYVVAAISRREFAAKKSELTAHDSLTLIHETPGPRGGGALVFRVDAD